MTDHGRPTPYQYGGYGDGVEDVPASRFCVDCGEMFNEEEPGAVRCARCGDWLCPSCAEQLVLLTPGRDVQCVGCE